MQKFKISRSIRRTRTTSYAGLVLVKRLVDQLELREKFNTPEFIKVHGHALTSVFLALIIKSIMGTKSLDDFEDKVNDDIFLRKICYFTKKIGKTVLGRNMRRFKPAILQGEYFSLINQLQKMKIVTFRKIAIDSTFIEVKGKNYQKTAEGWSNGKVILGYRLSVAFDIDSKLPIAYILTPGNKHDSQFLVPLLEIIKSKYEVTPDLVVVDRGYYGADFFLYLYENGIELEIPVKKYTNIKRMFNDLDSQSFQRNNKLKLHYKDDYIWINGYGYLRVIWIVNSNVEEWMPEDLKSGEWWGIITNRVDHSATAVIQAYKDRWEIEVFFRSIKQRMALIKLLGRKFHQIQAHIFFVFVGYILLMLIKYLTSLEGDSSRIDLTVIQTRAIFVKAVIIEKNQRFTIHFTLKYWLYYHFEDVTLM